MMRPMTTTSFRDAERLDAELHRWLRLEESLLIEMTLTHHGYSVRLVFDLTRTSEGGLRSDLTNVIGVGPLRCTAFSGCNSKAA